MEASRPLPRFSMAVHVYMWLFFVLLGFVPLFVTRAVIDRLPMQQAFWIAAWVWPLSMALLFLYARHQCSGARMTFHDGLLWVAWSMMTGWMYQSFFTVFAGLGGAFCAGVFVALAGDLRRDRTYAPATWLLIVKFFHRHRMRQ